MVYNYVSKRIHRLLLKFGIQISFCNNSQPLLSSARSMLIKLGFHPSQICNYKQFYLTRQQDLRKFFRELGFNNSKHYERFIDFFQKDKNGKIRGIIAIDL